MHRARQLIEYHILLHGAIEESLWSRLELWSLVQAQAEPLVTGGKTCLASTPSKVNYVMMSETGHVCLKLTRL